MHHFNGEEGNSQKIFACLALFFLLHKTMADLEANLTYFVINMVQDGVAFALSSARLVMRAGSVL